MIAHNHKLKKQKNKKKKKDKIAQRAVPNEMSFCFTLALYSLMKLKFWP